MQEQEAAAASASICLQVRNSAASHAHHEILLYSCMCFPDTLVVPLNLIVMHVHDCLASMLDEEAAAPYLQLLQVGPKALPGMSCLTCRLHPASAGTRLQKDIQEMLCSSGHLDVDIIYHLYAIIYTSGNFSSMAMTWLEHLEVLYSRSCNEGCFRVSHREHVRW